MLKEQSVGRESEGIVGETVNEIRQKLQNISPDIRNLSRQFYHATENYLIVRDLKENPEKYANEAEVVRNAKSKIEESYTGLGNFASMETLRRLYDHISPEDIEEIKTKIGSWGI